jgi:hypothetical protein
MDRNRSCQIVIGVVREALRSSGRAGVALSGGGPEEALLGAWLEAARIPFTTPGESALGLAKGLLSSLGPADSRLLAAEASGLAGWALAWAEGLLLVGTANKTCLLLSPTQPVQSVLPLGDIYASRVEEMAGESTRPPCLIGASFEQLLAVDRALEAYYVGEFGKDAAFWGVDPGLRETVLAALDEARRGWHPKPLIPKLGDRTLGLDLDP